MHFQHLCSCKRAASTNTDREAMSLFCFLIFSPFYLPVYFIRRGEEEQIFFYFSLFTPQYVFNFLYKNFKNFTGPYEAKWLIHVCML